MLCTTLNGAGWLLAHKRIAKEYKCICRVCKTEFIGARRTAFYCSSKCLSQADYKKNMLNYKWRLTKLLAMAKNRAKEKQVPFNLDAEFLINLWEETNGTCPISGRSFDLNQDASYTVNMNAPSIDRIVPSLGYVKGNVRIVIYMVNVAMSEYGSEHFMKLIDDIVAIRNFA